MIPICLSSNEMFPSQSASKVILDLNMDFIFIIELCKLDKIGRKSTKKSLRSKTQILHVWNNYPKLAQQLY